MDPKCTRNLSFLTNNSTVKRNGNYSIMLNTRALQKVSSHFLISQEPVVWPWCNLAASQEETLLHICEESLSHGASQLAVRLRLLSLCTVWPSHSQWPSEQITFITTMRLPILQLSCRLFWPSITSPRSVSPPTAQTCIPATSGFSQS